VDTKVDTGIRPMLLNEISEEDVQKYINDPDWCAQQKFDGERRLANGMSGINRKGQAVVLSKEIMDDLKGKGSITIDGELINNELYIFDCLIPGKPDISYKERLEFLDLYYHGNFNIRVIATAYTSKEKQQLFNHLKAKNAEGIVFKDLRAMYTPSRPASGGSALKFKFCDTCTCIVGKVSTTKRSVALILLDEKGNEIDVGNATIYPNFNMPVAGDKIELKYLYAYKGGSIYQPVYLGLRTDIDREECLLSQLKYKAGTV